MKKLQFAVFCFLLLAPASCQLYSGQTSSTLSAKVTVVSLPYGAGDSIRPSSPVVFLSGGALPCRPEPVDVSKVRQSLESKISSSGSGDRLAPGVFEDLFGDVEEDGEVDLADGQRDPVIKDVGENWLKLGLYIGNGNQGVGKNFWLIVENISFRAVARHRGFICIHQGNLDSGQCEDGVPFLYVVPPGLSVTYKPKSRNHPLENLTLYIEGFPIVDRSQEFSPDLARQAGEESQGSAGGCQEDSSALGGLQNQQESLNLFGRQSVKVIPPYTVELTLHGFFVDKNGDRVAAYVGRTRFSTISSFR